MRVLIVDDEVDILDLLDIWLTDDPRCEEVRRTDNLDEALSTVTAWTPHVLVLDFYIGKRTCVEILPSLRRACPRTRIIVHTASRRAAEAAGAVAAGADFVIEKNHYSIDALIDRILEPLDRPQHGDSAG
ncbi:MAG TPA: response regulator [Mycobacteriales bacterium]|nr:response regulator [Mycobacteriales bacterium]